MNGIGPQASASSPWVCPSDRHLALRAQLKAGWSVKTQSDSPSMSKDNNSFSETELEQIKHVLDKANRAEKLEQERIGRLVDKLGRMKRVAAGNGVNQCFLCGSEFGLLGARSYAAMCHDCRKYVCQKNCGVDTWNTNAQPIFLCKLCSETREMWKKTGAWFYHDVPKFVLPEPRPGSSEPSRNRKQILVPTSISGQIQENRGWADEWDSAGGNRASPESVNTSRGRGWASSNSYERTNRTSPVRRRMLPVPPSEQHRTTAFQPRWAIREPATETSSSDEEGLVMKRGSVVKADPSQQPQHGRQQQQLHSREIGMARGRRFTDTTSSEEDDEPKGKNQQVTEGDGGRFLGTSVSRRSATSKNFAVPSSDSPSTFTAVTKVAVTSPVATEQRTTGFLDQGPSTSRTDSPDARSIDSGGPDARSIDSGVLVLHSDQSASRPTSLGASSDQSKFNARDSQSHSVSSENLPLPSDQHDKICLAPSGSRLSAQINASQEKLTKLHLESDGAVNQALHTPVSEALSSPDDEASSLGTVEFSLKFDPNAETLTAIIARAKNLKAMDSNGFSDPYVKLHLLPDSTKSTKLRTRTVRRSLNPEWNEQLVYHGVTEDDRQKKIFLLTILDEDRFGSDFLGETRVLLKRLTSGREKLFNVFLEKQRPIEKVDEVNEERGKLLLNLQYIAKRQVLVIGILRCVELIGMDSSGYSDPYVKVSLKPESEKHHRAKTKVKKRTLNPIFNEQFEFCVALPDLAKKVLHLTVWDRDVGKQDDFIGGIQLGVNAKGDRQKHWTDCIKNSNQEFQRWHRLNAEKH